MDASRPPLNDPESFSYLFSRTKITIFRFIYGLHGGPVEEVEDLTSDTYMKAWKARTHFFGDNNDELCWLFTIARHLVIDYHRKKQTHPENNAECLDEMTLNNILSISHGSPEEKVSAREQFILLWDLLHSLPDNRREMLVLRYMVGWQVKQIASFLNMEENTVSVYIRRSLEQIRHDWPES